VLEALASSGPALAFALAAAGLAIGLPALRRLLPVGTLSARRGLPATILSRGLLTFAFFGRGCIRDAGLHDGPAPQHDGDRCVHPLPTLTWTVGSWLQARLSHSRQGGASSASDSCCSSGASQGWPSRCALACRLGRVHRMERGRPGMGLAYAPTSLLTLSEASAARTGGLPRR